MRIYKKAIALLVVVGLLVGAYVFISKKETPQNTTQPDSKKYEKVIEVDKEKISEVTIVNTEGKFVFKKNGAEWVLAEPKDFKTDNSSINSIISNVSSIVADKVIEENAADLAQYGFNKPVQITVKYDAGVKELEIGSLNPTKDAYYVKEKGSSKVYTVSSYTGDTFMVSKNDLRDKTILSLKPEEATALSMWKNENLIFTAKKGEDKWLLTAPIEGNANDSEITPMLDAISQNAAYTSFVEEKPSDLDKYGLKNPHYALEFETAAGKTKLLLGSEKVKGSEIYAKLADKNEVFTINVSSMTFLDKPLKEIIEVFAYITNINDVSKIVVEMDGKTTVSEIFPDPGEDTDKDKFTVNGKDATMKDDKDNSLFRKYYQALIGVTMVDIDPAGKPTGKPEITFTYTLRKDPGTMKVEFISKDADYYYVVRNGKYANILVAKKKFNEPEEGVRATQQKILDAIK